MAVCACHSAAAGRNSDGVEYDLFPWPGEDRRWVLFFQSANDAYRGGARARRLAVAIFPGRLAPARDAHSGFVERTAGRGMDSRCGAGARRCVRLGPVLAEPSELLKLGLVFFLADFLSRREARMRELKACVLPAILIVLPIVAMLLKQPDFGSAVIVVTLVFAMLLAAGARLKHLAETGGVMLSGLAVQAIAKPYRIKRFAAFLDPWRAARGDGFQL